MSTVSPSIRKKPDLSLDEFRSGGPDAESAPITSPSTPPALVNSERAASSEQRASQSPRIPPAPDAPEGRIFSTLPRENKTIRIRTVFSRDLREEAHLQSKRQGGGKIAESDLIDAALEDYFKKLGWTEEELKLGRYRD